MLPPAILNVADRLAAILMALVDAISPIALGGSTPTFSNHAAQTLFFRLVHLVTTLIRIDNFGIRAPAKSAATPAPTHPAPIAQRSGPAQRFPSHPGWLLAALPNIAPAIAADLAALLAGPDLIALLAATPTLHRSLRPLFRSLGLTQPPPSPPRTPGPSSTQVDPSRVGCSAPHQSSSATPITDSRFLPTWPTIHPDASNRPISPSSCHDLIVL